MDSAEELVEGEEKLGLCEGGSFKYYSIHLTDTSKLVIISYFPLSADPDNDHSDPDIYVTNQAERVTQGRNSHR